MKRKIIKNKILDDMPDADTYYLASSSNFKMIPIKLGGRWELMKLTELIKEDDIVFEQGLEGFSIFIVLDKTEEEIKKLTDKIK